METKPVPICTYKMLFVVMMIFIVGCSTTSAVKPLGLSKSVFDGDSSQGQTVILNENASEGEYYRASEEDYLASIAQLKDKTAQNADAFCGSQGKAVKPLRETTSKPPHLFIFGNTPRAELIFTCVDKPKPVAPASAAKSAPAAAKAPEKPAVVAPATVNQSTSVQTPVNEKQTPVEVASPAPAPPAPSGQKTAKAPSTLNDAKYEKLVKLKKLLDNGILTREEFNREKTKILNE